MRLVTTLILSTGLFACGEKSEDTGTQAEETVEPSGEDTSTAVEATPEELGQALYEAKCMACHGADAAGGSGPNILNESDAKFSNVIKNGDGSMPAFPELSDEDISNIIAYVRSL